MSIARPEDLIITELVGELEIPCDHMGDGYCPGDVAKWAMLWSCPHCTNSGLSLACDECKDGRMASECGVEDIAGCGEVIAPARHMYSRVEAL